MNLQILSYRKFTQQSYKFWDKVYTLAKVLEIEEKSVFRALNKTKKEYEVGSSNPRWEQLTFVCFKARSVFSSSVLLCPPPCHSVRWPCLIEGKILEEIPKQACLGLEREGHNPVPESAFKNKVEQE